MPWKVEAASNAAATTWVDITNEIDPDTASFGGQAYEGEVGQGSGFDLVDEGANRTLASRRVVRVTLLRHDYYAATRAKLPIAYWRFGEPSGTTADDEIGSRDGTYVNSPTLGVAGAQTGDTNTAVTFDAVIEVVTLAADTFNSTLEGVAPWSVGLWVKPAVIDASPRRIFHFFDVADVRGIIAYADNTGTYLSRETGTGAYLSSGPVLSTGVWSFVIWTYDGSTLRYYLNGASAATPVSAPGSVASMTGSTNLIGSDSSNGWNGTLDEMAVWNRALTATEIAELYERGTEAYPVLADVQLFRGRIVSKALGRGRAAPVLVGRQFDVELADYNQDLRGLQVDLWNRNAETDYARIQALAVALLDGTPRASTDLDRTTYVPNTNTVTMAKKRYEATDPAGVIADLIDQSGKTAFVTVDGQLFYDTPTSTAYAASLAITDDHPNLVDQFPPIFDGPAAEADGSELYTRATLIKVNGQRIGPTIRTATEASNDVWGLTIYDDDKTGTTSVQALTNFLNEHAKEDTAYRCSILLHASQVWMVKWGQTVNFRAAAAGVLAPIGVRIVRLMWRSLPDGDYMADLELDYPMKANAKRPRGGIYKAPTFSTVRK